TRGSPRRDVALFLRFVLSSAGQALVGQHGFVPGETPPDVLATLAAAAGDEGGDAPPAAHGLFTTGSASVDAAGKKVIADVAGVLATRPNLRVVVMGNADAEGLQTRNEQLAKLRAARVVDALRTAGVSSERITVDASSSDHPVASNASGAGRSQNRRVEDRKSVV